MRVAASDPAAPEAVRLMAELSAVLAAITGDSGQSSFDLDDVRGPRACFALARSMAAGEGGDGGHDGDGGGEVHGQAVGCGAFRPLEDGVAELKRMYARPGYPGTGSAILAFLEAEAAALGYRALRLSTRRVNARALGFYQARGYRVTANFGRYAGRAESVCLEKRL